MARVRSFLPALREAQESRQPGTLRTFCFSFCAWRTQKSLPHQRYRLRDTLVIAQSIDDGWWQLTDVAWKDRDGHGAWIWSLSPDGTIYEGMVIDGRKAPYRTTGGDTGLTLADLQPG